MANTPLASIIVPIYNVGPYLLQCLESIRSQTFTNFEAICIDDGSTDGSGDILDAIAQEDERFIVVHRENAGYGSAMNEGIARARGPYIGIVEPDDYIEPSMLEVLIDAAERHNEPDIVKASYWRICQAGTPEEHCEPSFHTGRIEPVDRIFTIGEHADLLLYHPSIWTALYRRDFLSSEGIRFLECPGAGWVDNPFLMETMCAARSIVYIDEPLYCYREFSEELSGGLKDPRIIAERWIDMDEVLKRRGVTAPAVREAHLCRGCAYLEMLEHDFDPQNSEVRALIDAMLQRMDSGVIKHSTNMEPSFKRSYIQALMPLDRLRYHFKR